MTFRSMALVALVAGAAMNTNNNVSAFMQQKPVSPALIQKPESSTSLHVIGGVIRKMREEKAKKEMPMASEEERKKDAPGLRVGKDAWKWPPVWPYDKYMFTRPDEIPKKPQPNMASMMASASGTQMPPPVVEEEEEIEELDLPKFWGEENSSVLTEMDDAAIETIKNHYAYYLRDGMSVLELGAAENSYLPDDIKLSRHVGVGLNKALMETNPSISESMVVNLNKVLPEKSVDSEELLGLGADTFDTILMANTIEYMTNPREVFRTAWYLLKPGGMLIVPFTNKEAFKGKFGKAQTNAWETMSDDQHVWVTGSFFQFSAGDGWENLKGFDISPASAKREDGPLAVLQNQGKTMSTFVVQATKGLQAAAIDDEDPEKSFSSKMWMLQTVEERDKKMLAPRLARAFQLSTSGTDKEAMARNVDKIPTVYDALIKMDTFAFPFNLQSQLASYLVADPGFEANDEQIKAMKMGLGLLKPDSEFWTPVGTLTAAMEAEEKVNLLAYIVPRFGSGNVEQENALKSFASGLEPTFATIRSKCVGMEESDVQLVGTELLAKEILKPGISSRKEFALWLGSFTESELNKILSNRKEFKDYAVREMKKYQGNRKAEADRIEQRRENYDAQLKKAKKERTLFFNPEKGKLEEVKGKKKEKK